MPFWSKTVEPARSGDRPQRPRIDNPPAQFLQTDVARKNPETAARQALFDERAKIARRATELAGVAAKDMAAPGVVIALQTALGRAVANLVLQREPKFSETQRLFAVSQILERVSMGLRDEAHEAAGVGSISQDQDAKLTAEQFDGLAHRVLQEATKHNPPLGDALAATAKALGVIISMLAEQPGMSADDLIAFSKRAVTDFARDALRNRIVHRADHE